MKPYVNISDTHNHAWNAFSTVGPDGINSRLSIILNEFERAARVVTEAGGDTIYHAGDLFHVRGSVAPSVLNPTRDAMDRIASTYNIKWRIMPGNHDMEMKEASRVGDSVQAVAGRCAEVIHEPKLFDGHVMMVPWMSDLDALRKTLTDIRNRDPGSANVDLIIHAPVDGVIKGIPDHGLSPQWLADLGFNRVFAGHYHNHKDFGNGVYSIGAIAHHTWSDVGSKAGFLLVSDDKVEFHASHAPQFVDIEPGMDELTMQHLCDGNYVRARIQDNATDKEINQLRKHILSVGAKGVNIISVKSPTHVRSAVPTIKAGSSLEESVAEYVRERKFKDQSAVLLRSQVVLAEASMS